MMRCGVTGASRVPTAMTRVGNVGRDSPRHSGCLCRHSFNQPLASAKVAADVMSKSALGLPTWIVWSMVLISAAFHRYLSISFASEHI
jgi:hypothetical protein